MAIPRSVSGFIQDSIIDLATPSIADLARSVVKALVPSQPPNEGFSEVFIVNKLAVEFGDESKLADWVASLDKELASASFFAIKEIKQKKAYKWEEVIAAFNNADALTQIDGSHRRNVRKWSKNSSAWFNFDGSPDSEDVEQLKTWFKGVITELNPKIYDNSELVQNGVIDKLAKIANETGARVNDFGSFFHGTDSHREKVLEISVVRFPNKTQPHILLYRLEVQAWFASSRILFVEENQAGFEVDVQQMKFELNPKIADAISEEHVHKFKEKLEDPDTFDF
ncbi:MAG: hypothetical protein AAFW70_24420 [Cyanobacteria bacterium J06635_10]